MADTDTAQKTNEASGMDRLREEAVHYFGAQMEHLVEKAGDKVSDLTGQLGDVAENGGVLPKVGARVLQGDSPIKAFLGEKAKSIKDNVVDKVKGAFGGGKPGRKSGKKPMNMIETLDIGLPVRTVYDHWTKYEDFSGLPRECRASRRATRSPPTGRSRSAPRSAVSRRPCRSRCRTSASCGPRRVPRAAPAVPSDSTNSLRT